MAYGLKYTSTFDSLKGEGYTVDIYQKDYVGSSTNILLGGNQKSCDAGLSYWNQGYNYVSGQLTTTTAAINYVRDLALQVIANTTVTTVTGTVTTQVINPFYQYGGDYMPQQSIARNFNIITSIIVNNLR